MFRNLLLGGDWKVTVWTGGRPIRGTKVRLGPYPDIRHAAAHGKNEHKGRLGGLNESRSIELSASAQRPKKPLKATRGQTVTESILGLQVNKEVSILVERSTIVESSFEWSIRT